MVASNPVTQGDRKSTFQIQCLPPPSRTQYSNVTGSVETAQYPALTEA